MRLRIKFAKRGTGRFLSQLEVMRSFHRAARRAGLPLALSQGFNPHPLFSFGPALAVGRESEAEYLDLELKEPCPPAEVLHSLAREMPPGLEILAVKSLPQGAPALTEAIRCAAYRVEVEGLTREGLERAIRNLLGKNEVRVRRQTKRGEREVDLRPGLYRLELEGDRLLTMLLACSSQLTVRPEEVVRALAPGISIISIRRTELYTRCDSALVTPLD